MTSATTSDGPSTRPSRPVRGGPKKAPVVPPQHGAWGFLGLPLLLGIAAGGWSFWLPALAVAWVAAYPCSWAFTGLLTARRPERFRRAAVVWLPICAGAGLPLLITHLWLAGVLAVYVALFLVNLQQARARRERSMFNDLVLIAECALLIPVMAGIVTGTPAGSFTGPVVTAMVICALTLTGSTMHVKSLIRERNNPRFTTGSRAFAVTSAGLVPLVALAAGLPAGRAAALTVPFVLLAVRAWVWHDPTVRPARIGMRELVGLLLVAATGLTVL